MTTFSYWGVLPIGFCGSAFFGVMMVFHFLWALWFVPETKGTSLA